MKKCFAVQNQTLGVNLALLLMRLVVGYAFMNHGWGKIQHPMEWMGPQGYPGIFQLLAAVSEFGGGLALILGLLTRLGALGISFTMLVAVCTHAFILGDPFIHPSGGRSFEQPATFLVIALLLAAGGPGKFSLDRKIFGVK